MNLETIRLDVDGGVATITLNRPDRLNAYTVQMGLELFGTLRQLNVDDTVRAIVVTGAGRAFCAGADLKAGADTFRRGAFDEVAALEKKVRPWNMLKPVVAAINGPAVGIGATLPLHWDIRIAGESARIGFVFARRGLIPEAGSTWILPRLIGLSRSLDLLLTGRILDAAEALEYGLVSQVVPDDELLAVAQQIAHDIAANTAPASISITRRLLWRGAMNPNAEDHKTLEDELFYWVAEQPDAKEGIASFLEERTPQWTMTPRSMPDVIPDVYE